MMRCRFFNEISDDWVEEKLNCINPNEMEIEREIERLIRSKLEEGQQHFTPEEFTLFLRWKGLARRKRAFLTRYNTTGEVEKLTRGLFTSKLMKFTFKNTQDESLRNKILDEVNTIFNLLQQLKYVGPGVASACLALCFPELCATADYIVPALLHNENDQGNNRNPLYKNSRTAQMLQQALIMPMNDSLTASQARTIAFYNYTRYVQEFWNIKRVFGLNYQVRKIEAAIWSFGICYISKGRDSRNRPVDNEPLIFNSEPNPPRGGPFAKHCPNKH